MTPKASGGSSRSRVSLLFATVFIIATIRWVVQQWFAQMPAMEIFADSRFWLVGTIGLLFGLGALYPRTRIVEPFVFLILAIIPIAQTPEAVYGFGMFAVGTILLYVDGRLSRHPLWGMALLGVYLFVLIVVSTIVNNSGPAIGFGMVLFTTAFFLFLFLTFQDKIVVFVNAAKPLIRLSEFGLTTREAEQVMALLRGLSMKEIAWQSGVKESTIRNSLSRIYHKLGLTDKTQLLQWAERHDIQA